MNNLPCALCGYPTLGDFYVRVPGHPDHVMHTVSCGPILVGMERVAEPTYRRLPNGTYQEISQSQANESAE